MADHQTDTARPHEPPHAPVHSALQLTEGGNKAHIVLDDKCYTLFVTRNGKLILNK